MQFLDSHGRVLATPTVRDEPTGYVPTIPNSGVGLLPLSDPGQPGASGVRGQAALPLQYSDNECATSVAAVQLTLSSGSLTAALTLPGSDFSGCLTAPVTVNPFQPAEGVV